MFQLFGPKTLVRGENIEKFRDIAVADPGFPRGAPIGKIFAENCMKMKEIEPRGGVHL